MRSSPGNTKPEVENGARACEGGIFDRGIGISGEDQLKWLVLYLLTSVLTKSHQIRVEQFSSMTVTLILALL